MLELLKLKLKKNKPGIITKKGDYIGSTRYYPPASQEWFSNIYAYNKKSIKSLPVLDNFAIKLIRSYFYMFSSRLEKILKSPRLRMWMRRLSTDKILVSKPELKHTSEKVIITLYIYNRNYANHLKKWLSNDPNFILKINLLKLKGSSIISRVKEEIKFLAKTLRFKTTSLANYEKNLSRDFLQKSLKKETISMYLKQILILNKFKFRDTLILPLKNLIRLIYGKDVEFNLITLKDFHLNSDIFTQIVTLKTSNRKNKLLPVIRSSLRKVWIPKLNKVLLIREPTVLTGIQNIIINDSLSNNSNTNSSETKDSLNIILNNKFKSLDLQDTVLNSLKYKNIGGLRIEAAGRLTKRITASRSLYKFRYIGTLKNIESSYRGKSSVILKGNQKSNIEYTQLKSVTRVGAFGIKGWLSGS